MKTIIQLCLLILLAPVVAHATIRTVSNDINHPAQFNDMPAAMSAANNGDTIYVSATQYLYSDFTVTRQLVIIGAGFNSANQFNLISQVNNIYFYKDAASNNGSGTVISGFRVYQSITLASSSLPISNIKVFRNQISGINGIALTNWAIYNNVFPGTSCTGAINGSNTSSNVVIQNNIFYGTYGNINNFNQPSVVIDHNMFINVPGGCNAGSYALNAIAFALITNNIFTSSSSTPVFNNVTQCTFNNNLSVSATLSQYTPANLFSANNNSAVNNLVGIANPMFTTMANFNAFTSTDNYRLLASSPGHLTASDGTTDIGIYGGVLPFPSGGAIGGGYDTSPLPPIPQINSVNIQNAAVLPGAQLQVNVSATVNN